MLYRMSVSCVLTVHRMSGDRGENFAAELNVEVQDGNTRHDNSELMGHVRTSSTETIGDRRKLLISRSAMISCMPLRSTSAAALASPATRLAATDALGDAVEGTANDEAEAEFALPRR